MQIAFDKSTSYGLCAASAVAHSLWLEPQTAHQIAIDCNLPEAVLRKTLLSLSRAGLLKGTRGKGYVTGPHGSECSVLDVLDAIRARKPVASGCFLKEGACPFEGSCPMRSAWRDVHTLLHERLAAIAISSLPVDAMGVPVCFREGTP